MRPEARLITVEVDAADVERRLVAGELVCPACGGMLTPWGWARPRGLRGMEGTRLDVRPRRSRCSVCQVTHVLLPVSGLSRRADTAGVIGTGLEMKAAGAGHRRIAEWLGRPYSTVRGWLRAFAVRAAGVAGLFTSHLVALADDPSLVLPASAPSVFGDAVAAVIGAAMAVRDRFSVVTAPIWEVASAISRGLLLAPGWPPTTRR